ncbi:chorismate-binding protein [Ferroplasma acidiphilum]|uniref:chorismate-binding protein n=1 Tax=Ferroplasma acidiphilum TaxID=74969 RepID=UPI002814DE46|nr:chorismate-binding protein [Ferroplasma acidiphilum]WMT52936.1 MAG: chorismate-binding protein [Ferroplasma acidiphilum]
MLLDRINEFKGKNFAYFCKFDDERRTGTETLFVSGKEPINVYNGAINHMNNEFAGIIKSGKNIPVIVSYDFIDDIYPDIKLKRSSWPQVSYIIPEEEFSGTYIREKEQTTIANGDLDDNELEGKIGDAIKRIKNGDLLQIVLSRRFDLDVYDALYVAKKFLKNDKSLYVYYYKFGDLEVIGSSPENLLSVQNGTITIYPVAGTRKRGKSESEDKDLENDLKSDQKELLEHRMLVDLARNDLGRICYPGSVDVLSSMEIRKFASVMHIVSMVSGKLEEYAPGNILRSVFPAGTVSGAPKKKAITLINGYEDMPRGAYAGALGVIGNNGMDLALLIRSLFKSKNESYTQAGAGIVKDSVPSSEIAEMYSKILTVTGGLYEKNINY